MAKEQNPPRLKAFYDFLKQGGLVSNLPDYDKFSTSLQDTTKRRDFHTFLKDGGLVSNLPDYDKFSSSLFVDAPKIPGTIARPAQTRQSADVGFVNVPELDLPEPSFAPQEPQTPAPRAQAPTTGRQRPRQYSPSVPNTANLPEPQASPIRAKTNAQIEAERQASRDALLARSREIRDNTFAFNEAGQVLGYNSPDYQSYVRNATTIDERSKTVESELDKLRAEERRDLAASMNSATGTMRPRPANLERQRRITELETGLAEIGKQRARMASSMVARTDMDKVKAHVDDLARELNTSIGTPHEVTVRAQLDAMKDIYSQMGMDFDSFTAPESRARAAENVYGALGRGAFSMAPALMEFVAIKSKQLDTALGGVDPKIKDKEVAELASYRLAQQWREEINKEFPQNPEYAESFMFEIFPQAGGQLMGQMLMGGGMTGLAGRLGADFAAQRAISTALVATTAGAQNAAQVFKEAKEAGLSDADATTASDWAFIPGILEAIPVMRSLERMNQYTNGLVKPYFKNYVMSGLIGGAEEATTESLGNFLTNLNAIHISAYDKDRSYWEGMVEGGAAGGAAGFVANFVMAFMGSKGMRNLATEAPTRIKAIDDSLAELERVLADPATPDKDKAPIRDTVETYKKNRTTILEVLEDEKAEILSELNRLERRGGADAVRSDRFNDLVTKLEKIDNTILDANQVDPDGPVETPPVAPAEPIVETPAEPEMPPVAPAPDLTKPPDDGLPPAPASSPVVAPEPTPAPVVTDAVAKPVTEPVTPPTGAPVAEVKKPTAEATSEPKPIRQLGTGADVYFETDKIRVNSRGDKPGFVLNVSDNTNSPYPVANIEFDNARDAVKIAEEISRVYPNGVPPALLVDKYVEQLRASMNEKPVAEPEKPKASKPTAIEKIQGKIKELERERNAMRAQTKKGLFPDKLGENPEDWFKARNAEIRKLKTQLGRERMGEMDKEGTFTASNGNIVVMRDGFVDVIKKDGNPYKKNMPGRATAITEAIEGGFIPYEPYFPSMDEWGQLSMDPKGGPDIARESGDPILMAQTFLSLGKLSEQMGEFGTPDDVIADYFGTDGARISTSSIEAILGKAFAGQKNQGTMLLRWGGGKRGIDVYAKELTELSGMEITPQDIVDHMMRYPSRNFNPVKMTPQFREMVNEFESRFGTALTEQTATRLAKGADARFKPQNVDEALELVKQQPEAIDMIYEQTEAEPDAYEWAIFQEKYDEWLDEQFKKEGLTDEQIEAQNAFLDAAAQAAETETGGVGAVAQVEQEVATDAQVESEIKKADDQIEQIAEVAGTKVANIRDMYRVNRQLFGLNRVQALASAIASDRMIETMAKRAGITKAQMYARLEFRKADETEVPASALRQLAERKVMIDGQEVTLKPLPDQLEVVNGFYSPIEKALAEITQDKGTASQFLAQIKKAKGVKADELKYTGVEQYLTGLGDARISKQEVMDFMRDNRIRIERVVYGETPWEQRKIGQWTRKIDGRMTDGRRIPNAKVTITYNDDGLYYGENSVTKFVRKFETLEEAMAAYDGIDALSGDGKYSEYVLPGDAENYKELVITYPRQQLRSDVKVVKREDIADAEDWYPNYVVTEKGKVIDSRRAYSALEWEVVGGDTVQEALDAAENHNHRLFESFTNSHFKHPNVLAHIRMNTREDQGGNTVLFIEEIQSDWAQRGRKKGFTGAPIEVVSVGKINNSNVESWEVGSSTVYFDDELPKEIQYQVFAKRPDGTKRSKQFSNFEDSISWAKENSIEIDTVPTAPFVTDTSAWVRLALKSAIQEAVARGATRIAWTNGDQQNKRYSLSKTVKRITAAHMPSGYAEVYIDLIGGAQIMLEVDRGNGIVRSSSANTYNGKKLSEIVGMELANKILNQEKEVVQEYEGDGLDVGGNGMRSFYDRIVPKEAKAVVKDITGKEPVVSQVEFDDVAQGMAPFRTVEITNGDTVWESADSPYTIFSYGGGYYGLELNKKPVEKSFDSWTEVIAFVTKEYNKRQPATTQQSIEITPEIVAATQQGLPLFQRDFDKAKGAVSVSADGAAVIYALTDPDVSTPMHELAHVFEKYMTEAERNAVLNWTDSDSWDVNTSEAFARGFEKFLAEGVAPTPELRGLFERFKQWLTDIYNGITTSAIDIDLNDDMRRIYNSMLGFDGELAPRPPPPAPSEGTYEYDHDTTLTKKNFNQVIEAVKAGKVRLAQSLWGGRKTAIIDEKLLERFKTGEYDYIYQTKSGEIRQYEGKKTVRVGEGMYVIQNISTTPFKYEAGPTANGNTVYQPPNKVRVIEGPDQPYFDDLDEILVDGKPVKTGDAVTLTLYRGEGGGEDIVTMPFGNVMDGTFYALSESEARAYGKDVSKTVQSFKNPLVIRNNEDLKRIGAAQSDMAKARDAYWNAMQEGKHDALIVIAPKTGDNDRDGNNAKSLRKTFGHSQVVVFDRERGSAVKYAKLTQVDGVTRSRLNSEGKPIHPTDEGLVNFWRWFGDSKVVDSEGRPIVVYHGTRASFDSFRQNPNADKWSDGFFFSSDSRIAGDIYAMHEGFVRLDVESIQDRLASMSDSAFDDAVKVVEKITNGRYLDGVKAEIRDDNYAEAKRELVSLIERAHDDYEGATQLSVRVASAIIPNPVIVPKGASVIPGYLALKNPLVIDAKKDSFDPESQAGWIQDAKENGNDGVIISNYDDGGMGMGSEYQSAGIHNVFIALNNTQIKSSTGNSGAFNPASSDITDTPVKIKNAILVDGVARPRDNFDGKPIHPTDDGIRNFWRWFGDSKMVDDMGRPLVVYHGTSDSFSEFDLEHWNRKDIGWLGTGVYTTNAIDIAKTYAEMKRGESAPNIMPLYARIQNPYYATPDEKRRFLDMQNQNAYDGRLAVDAWTRDLISKGHDGVIYKSPYPIDDNSFIMEYVTFSNTGVKSAIGNSGVFSASGSDITDAPQTAVNTPGIAPDGEVLNVFGPIAKNEGPVGDVARQIISDVARIRTINPQVTDAHEAEIARFAQANPDPDLIRETVEAAIDRNTMLGSFNADIPLNLNAARKHGAKKAELNAEARELEGELKSVVETKRKRTQRMNDAIAKVMSDNAMTDEQKGAEIRKLREANDKAQADDAGRISVLTNKVLQAKTRAESPKNIDPAEGLFGVRDESQDNADGQVRNASERVPNRPKQAVGSDARGVRGDGYIPESGAVESREAEKSGETPTPKNVRPPLIYATRDGLPTPKQHVAKDRYDMDEHQQFATNAILERFSKPENKGYLLAHGAGVGKTSIILATADQVSERGKVLIITENKQIIAGSFAKDSQRMGIDLKRFELGTYSDVATGKIGKGDYELVIYDEAHNLKNPEAKKSIGASKIKAKHELFATATPMDTPSGAVYFASKVTGQPETQVWTSLGFVVRMVKDEATGIESQVVEFAKGTDIVAVRKNIVSLRDDMIKEGSMVRAEYPFYGAIKDIVIEQTMEDEQAQVDIEDYWYDLLEQYENPSFGVRRNLMGQLSGELSRYNEFTKMDFVVDRVMADIRAGRSVVVVAEGVNETYIKGIGQSVPGFLTEIKKRLNAKGIEVAEIYGTGDKSAAVERFQTNKVRVALATPKSGGTGINLDDTIGQFPRTLYMVTPNYSGNLFEQLIGRVSRRNSQSASELYVVFSNGASDSRRREIVGNKLNTMRAMQAGIFQDTELDFSELGGQQDAAFTRGDTNRPASAPSITERGQDIAVINSLYEHALVMRALGGDWNKRDKVWVFPSAKRDKVQEYINAASSPSFNPSEYAQSLLGDREGVNIAKGITAEPVQNKVFVLRGETKPIKDIIKAMGGKWNSNLVGWTFPTSEFNKVAETVKEAVEGYGSANKLVTTSEYRETLEKLFQKNGYLFSGVDPETGLLIGKLAAYHMEAGARKFSDFAARMVRSAGYQVVPYLRSVYVRAAKLLKVDPKELSTDAEITTIEDQLKRRIRYPRTLAEAMANLEDAYNLVIAPTPSPAIGIVKPGTVPPTMPSGVTTVTMEERSQKIHLAMANVAQAAKDAGQATSYSQFVNFMRRYYKNRFKEGEIRSGWVSMLVGIQKAQRISWAASAEWYHQLSYRVASSYENASKIFFQKVYSRMYGAKVMQDVVAGIYGDQFITDDKNAWQYQKLMPGMMSDEQHRLTDLENPRSELSLIYARIKELNIPIGDWTTYEKNVAKMESELRDLAKLQRQYDNALSAGNSATVASLGRQIETVKGSIRDLKAKTVQAVRDDKVQMFLHASHAIDRNRVLGMEVQSQMDDVIEEIRQLRKAGAPEDILAPLESKLASLAKDLEKKERGAGMTTAEAQAWLDELSAGDRANLQEIADMVYALNDKQLSLRVKYGLITQAYADGLRAKWGPTYVPLMREQLDENGFHIDTNPTGYSSLGVEGTGMMRAYGSDKPVMNILMSIKMRTDTAILKGHQNELLNTIANLFDSTANGNNLEESPFGYTRGGVQDSRVLKDKLAIPYRAKEMVTGIDPLTGNTVTIEQITDRLIVINPEYKMLYEGLIASPTRSKVAQQAIDFLRTFMNYLRLARTTLEPGFTFVSNPQRDLGTAMLNMSPDFGWKTTGRTLRNYIRDPRTGQILPAHRGVWDYLQGRSTPMADQYARLRELGGTTGVFMRRDPAEIYADMERLHAKISNLGPHKKRGWYNPVKYMQSYVDYMSLVSEVMENATRLTAFNTALQMGYSEKRAALYALEITTNFNEAGDWGFAFKVMYQFVNSSIQGTARTIKAAKRNPKLFAYNAMFLASIGAAVSEWNDMMDEEEHRRLRLTQPWLFETGVVFLTPGGGVIRIYLPFGYNVFKVSGDLAHAYQTGKISMAEAVTQMAQSTADAFNPFDGSRVFEAGLEGALLTATPTFARPLGEIAFNRSFTGPIYSPFELARAEQSVAPDVTIQRPNVDPIARIVAQNLAKSGIADISPNTIEYLTAFYTGSVGRSVWNLQKALNTDEARRDGFELPFTDAKGVPYKIMPNHIPIINRALRTIDQDRTAMSALYTNMNRLASIGAPQGSSQYNTITKEMIDAYNVLATSKVYDLEDRENVVEQINQALINNYRKAVVIPEVVEEIKSLGLTGRDNEEKRNAFYERYNRSARSRAIEKFPDPRMTNVKSLTNQRLFKSGSGSILDKNTIRIIEIEVL